ncbi:MAG: hypothetical protein H7838_04995 [Magnetococcus sp. DMHC-8]
MSNVSQYLAKVMQCRDGMDSRGLLVALYEIDRKFYNGLLPTDAVGQAQRADCFNTIERLFGGDGTSVCASPLVIPPAYWLEWPLPPANAASFVWASLQVLSVCVKEHILSGKDHFFDRVESPISGDAYLLVLRRDSPWASASARYFKPGDFRLAELHIVPEQEKFQKAFHRLPYDLESRMSAAIQQVPPPGEPYSVPVARMAVWPVHKDLLFAVRHASHPQAIAPEQPEAGHYLPFCLEDGNEMPVWDEQAAHFQQHVLPGCQNERILVLLLPELAVPPRFLALLQEAMRAHFDAEKEEARQMGWLDAPPCYPVLMVAGSFHMLNGTNPLQAVNRTVVLNYRGEEVLFDSNAIGREDLVPWSMEKLVRYEIHRSQLPDEATELIGALGLDDAGVACAVEPGVVGTVLPIVYAGSRLGLMTTAICIDFIDPAGLQPWLGQFQGKGWVDWVFVPSATPETEAFENTSKAWGKKGVCTVVVNACWLLDRAKKWARASFAMAGIPLGAPTARASRQQRNKRYARWRHGGTEATGFSLRPLLSDASGSCTLSCGECLAILDVELDDVSQRAG